ncbi:glycosyltransferase family 39 protein [Limobrevibacterium gyesilva]|uniref:Glycosyltransferase family 39 protein n=1 Tax=Limobrevibacterium gyesilva TaxID=2991712 RepID=A0AA41YRP5_9PROT|nr:glycosyltransferase family 39 protein [Limobrevibacterium gyesilva]
MAAATPLAPDEAYYWVWSRALAAGYLDHPPMVALWIRAGTWIAGDTALGVRLLGPLSAALGSLLLVRAGEDLLPGRRAGITAAALMNATLLFGVGAVTMTPDTPLLFFWTAALWALARLVATGRGGWWLVAGVAAGLALASKYTAVLLVPAVLVWLLAAPAMRPWLRRPHPWAAGVLVFLLFLPVLAWNAAHGWASFAKQGGRAGDWNPSRAAQFLGELLAGQVGLATPVIALLCGAGIVLAARRALSRDPAWTLLAALTLLPTAVFAQHALGDRVQANWPSVLYPAAAIAAAGLSGRWVRLVGPGIALGLALTLLVWVQGALAPLALPMRLDPTLLRLGGWDSLAAEVAAIGRREGAAYVASDNYGHAALLARLLPPDVPVYGVEPRWDLFNLPDARPLIAGRVGLLLRSARRDDAPDPSDWAEIARLGVVERARGGMAAEGFRVYRVLGRDGEEPIAVMPRPGR